MAKILVADDEADLEVLIKQKFRQKIREQQYEFVFAVNGNDALEKIQQHPDIDIVLSDINMPEMDGYSFIEQVRASGFLKKIPMLMLSASESTEVKIRCLQSGADDFIAKPFNPRELAARMNGILRRSRKNNFS